MYQKIYKINVSESYSPLDSPVALLNFGRRGWHLLKRFSFYLKNRKDVHNFDVELIVLFSYIIHIFINSFSSQRHLFTNINISNRVFQRKYICCLSNMIIFNFFCRTSGLYYGANKVKIEFQKKIGWEQWGYTET